MLKLLKIRSLRCLHNVSIKTFEMMLIFCMQINIKISYNLISTLWTSKFPTRWDYHYWRAWPSILKVLKVASLRYLYNIFKTNFGMELIFCIRINKVSRSWHYSFWSKWSNYQIVKGDRELFFSSEFMSRGLEWTTFEGNCFTASLKFDSKYKTFEVKIIQEP